MKYHNIVRPMPLPEAKEATHEALEKIFNIMIQSMDEKRQEEIIKDAMAYYNDLPPSVR